MSYNQISIDDTKVFAEALEFNHTLFGLHYQGNCGEVDSMQFLIPKASEELDLVGAQLVSKFDGVSPEKKLRPFKSLKYFINRKDKSLTVDPQQPDSNENQCWVC